MIRAAANSSTSKISGVVLLAGRLREQHFHRIIGRPIVTLPVSEHDTMWSCWMRAASTLARLDEPRAMALDLLIGEAGDAPENLGASEGVISAAHLDSGEVRGSAGVLRDHIERSGLKGHVIVANANQAVLGSFSDLCALLASAVRDIAVMPSADGTGGFLMLARAECLLHVSPKGFVDLKEQALPTLAARHDVRVVYPPPDSGPTVVRTHGDYLRLIARLHARGEGAASRMEDRFGDRFRIVEAGAQVAPDAVLQNSVVLRGGHVGAGAALAWCVVPSGGRIPDGTSVRNKVGAP